MQSLLLYDHDPVRYDTMRSGTIQYDTIRCDPMRSDAMRSDAIRYATNASIFRNSFRSKVVCRESFMVGYPSCITLHKGVTALKTHISPHINQVLYDYA